MHADTLTASDGGKTCVARRTCSPFPTSVANEQLRRLRRRQAPSTVEEASTKNLKNLAKAAKFEVAGIRDEATRRIPLDVCGRGCPVLREKVLGGWRPGPPFATHGSVGANDLCSPSAMREWIAAEPGAMIEPAASAARKAWPGGPMTSNKAAATEAFRVRQAGAQGSGLGKAAGLPIAVPSLTVNRRIEELRPSAAAGCAVPQWIPRFAAAAAAGENLWA